MRRLVATARVARLATVDAHGLPHLVPVCFAITGDVAYSAVDGKPKRTRRLRRVANVRATGRCCLLVDRYSDDWSALWWVRLDGTGRIVDDPAEASGALAALADRYPQYVAAPPAGPVLAVDVTRWTGWSATPDQTQS
ncbi:MAG TPA: TIGR03668 family PPOX class F420-dependent oxidoreductase [Actinocatenispora sp.]